MLSDILYSVRKEIQQFQYTKHKFTDTNGGLICCRHVGTHVSEPTNQRRVKSPKNALSAELSTALPNYFIVLKLYKYFTIIH